MGSQEVERYFAERNLPYKIQFLEQSSATVALAAEALGVEEGQIAKSLALSLPEGVIVLVVCGTARIDNHKYKETFHHKAHMLSIEDTLAATGHPVGGVCPFGLPDGVKVYLDVSLKNFDIVYPAGGTGNSAIRFTPDGLQEATDGVWVDVCK